MYLSSNFLTQNTEHSHHSADNISKFDSDLSEVPDTMFKNRTMKGWNKLLGRSLWSPHAFLISVVSYFLSPHYLEALLSIHYLVLTCVVKDFQINLLIVHKKRKRKLNRNMSRTTLEHLTFFVHIFTLAESVTYLCDIVVFLFSARYDESLKSIVNTKEIKTHLTKFKTTLILIPFLHFPPKFHMHSYALNHVRFQSNQNY